MKTNNTNKYYLYFEVYFSNWTIAHFKDKNNFILMNPYKQTKNNLYFFGLSKKNSICLHNDIEMIKNDFLKGCKQLHFNMALYEVDKNTYFEAIELLKNYSEFKKDDLKIFKDFYNRIEKDFENILK